MNKNKILLLLIEHEKADIKKICRALKNHKNSFKLKVARNLHRARSILSKSVPDMIISDSLLPDGDGMNLLACDKDGTKYPTLILVDSANPQAGPAAIEAGALDYVIKSDVTLNDMPHIVLNALHLWQTTVEHEKIKEEFAKQQSILNAITNNLTEDIFIKDKNSAFVFANRNILVNFGIESSKSIVGKSDFDFFEDEMAKKYYQEEQQIINTGKPMLAKEESFELNGKTRYFLSTKLPWRDNIGNTIGIIGMNHDVTKLKEVQNSLKEERNKLRTLIDNLPDPVWFKDTKSRFVVCNKKVSYILGKEADEITGKTDFDFYPRETAEKFYADEQEIIRTCRPLIIQNARGITERSKYFWWDVTKVPLLDSEGKMAGIIGISRDITDRKQATDALKAEKQWFSAIFEGSSDAIFIVDIKGQFVDANDAAYQLTGYTKSELKSMHLQKLLAPKDLYANRNVFTEILMQSPFKWEIEIRCKNGISLDAELSTKQIFIEDTTYIHILARDITIQKRIKEALIKRIRLNRLLLDSLPHPAMLVSKDRTILAINQVAQQFGAKVQGCCWRDFGRCEFIPEKHKIYIKKYNRVPPGGSQCNFCLADLAIEQQKSLHAPDIHAWGRIWDTHWIPLDNQTFLHFAIDITEHKQTEQKLLEYQSQLKSLASKLSLAEEHERRRLAAGVHDHIGQNLALIKLELQSLTHLTDNTDIHEPLKKICSIIDQAIKDAHSLTFELSNPVLYEVGLEAAIEQLLIEQVEEKHGIKYEFFVDNQTKKIDNDVAITVFQAVREILVNVVKHSKADCVTVHIEGNKDQLQIKIEDNGVGFTSDEMRTSLSENKKGGFGLFNVKERLEYIGGHFSIKSSPQAGTCVILSAPLKI